MTNQRAIPFLQFRGGSSKGLYFHEKDLPAGNRFAPRGLEMDHGRLW